MLIMDILTSWGVLGCPRVPWGIKTDRSGTLYTKGQETVLLLLTIRIIL